MAEQRHTICNRDCPDACGIVATVEDGRVTQLRGDPDHPVTRGFLCQRTSQFLRTQYHPDRITSPLMRSAAGELVEVSWDDALDRVAEQLSTIRAESGPEAIFHYRSGGTLGMVVGQASDLFFERFGPVTVKRGDICSGAGEAAQELDFGICESSDLFQLLQARQIILWGKNVYTSSPHMIPLLRQAREAGASLLLVDPVHHRSAQLCDRVLQPRPAADFELAMATARVLASRGWIHPEAATWCDGLEGFIELAESRTLGAWCQAADVSEEDVTDLARRLHQGPTTILVGWGMARRQRGGAIVRAIDALAAVTGNVGVAGAGASYYFRRRHGFAELSGGLARAPRSVCEPLFGEELERIDDPPIRAVWVTAANPVAMLPDSRRVAAALRSRDLLVVADSWLSDTAELADVVLPTTTLLEADDLVGAYGHHLVGEARPVVPPPAEVRSDLQIFQALAERLGLGGLLDGDARAFKERLIGPELRDRGIRLEDLDRPKRNPLAAEVLFEGRRFATPSGRCQLIDRPPAVGAATSDQFPLTLLSLSTPESQSSQWAKGPPTLATVTVHPDAASAIADGQVGELVSAIGRMRVRVRYDEKQRRDVAIVPKGGHLRLGSAANAITRARLTDLGEGGALYDEPVRLEPVRE